jgi:hypothetical protein
VENTKLANIQKELRTNGVLTVRLSPSTEGWCHSRMASSVEPALSFDNSLNFREAWEVMCLISRLNPKWNDLVTLWNFLAQSVKTLQA